MAPCFLRWPRLYDLLGGGGVLFGLVPASGGFGGLSAGGGGVTVVSGFVVEFGLTVLGVADGAFGAALGVFGAPVGVFGAAVGVWPCALGMVEELGVVAVGVFVVPGVVLCDCCGLMVLCELGLLDWAVPRAVPVLDWAYTQQPHSSTVLAKRLSLRFMFLTSD